MNIDISKAVVKAGDFAILLKKSRRTVEAWKKEGLPHNKQGIPLLTGMEWWLQERFKEMDALRLARTKKEEARAKYQELITKQLENRLIDREQNIVWLTQVSIGAKNGFWSLPNRLSDQLAAMRDGREIFTLLRKEIRAILLNVVEELKREYKNVDELSRTFRLTFKNFNKEVREDDKN
jgi:phage terminase Nu1 subunit (DNA packaging protein)